jgi:hypothetical protein
VRTIQPAAQQDCPRDAVDELSRLDFAKVEQKRMANHRGSHSFPPSLKTVLGDQLFGVIRASTKQETALQGFPPVRTALSD